MFPNCNGHVEVEIGSGKGNFMTDYAERHPDIFIMGSEWDYTWAAFAHERMQKRGVLGNAAMLRGDVFYFLRDAVKDNTVDAFHMYFPDPWPKERHHKNRLLRPDFLAEVARVLKPGKRIFYWGTDHKEYNEIALETFDAFPLARLSSATRPNPPKGSRPGSNASTRRKAAPSTGALSNFSNNWGSGPILTYSDIQIFIV
jgi:Predicted S-adenosylmethionine-dependent methyltransferase